MLLPSLRLAAILGLASLAAACNGTPDPGPPQPDRPAPLALAVATMEVRDQVTDVPVSFIDKRRSDELMQQARDYLQARYRAGGGSESGRAVIEKASILEQPRASIGGVRGFFTRDAKTELVGTLATRVAIADSSGTERAYARSEVQLKRPILEGSPVLERDRIARTLIRDLLAAQETALKGAVAQNLAAYVGQGGGAATSYPAPLGQETSPTPPGQETYPAPLGAEATPGTTPAPVYPPAAESSFPTAGDPYTPPPDPAYPPPTGQPETSGPRPLLPPT